MTVHGPKTAEDEYARVERFVEALLPKDRALKVLSAEAGEGRFAIRPPAYVVGADVVQAERGVRAGADEHRVLDLDHLQLETEEYDVVLCVNVLEHVRNPLAVVDSLWPALKDGGILVIFVPNVASLKGLFVRATPWAFHRWFYRRVLNVRPDRQPVRAFHSFSLRPSSLVAHAEATGWRVRYVDLYEGPVQRSVRERFGIVGWRWKIVTNLTRITTFGLLAAEETGLIAVLGKGGVESSMPK